MKNSIIHIIKNTFNFKGKTNRNDYWFYFFVALLIVNYIILSLVFGVIEAQYLKVNNINPNGLMFRNERSIINIVLLTPLISATVRRLRDAGFSIWFILIPIINIILCMYPSKNEVK